MTVLLGPGLGINWRNFCLSQMPGLWVGYWPPLQISITYVMFHLTPQWWTAISLYWRLSWWLCWRECTTEGKTTRLGMKRSHLQTRTWTSKPEENGLDNDGRDAVRIRRIWDFFTVPHLRQLGKALIVSTSWQITFDYRDEGKLCRMKLFWILPREGILSFVINRIESETL